MNKYYCENCEQVILRDCEDSMMNSYCATKSKFGAIYKMSDDVSEIYKLLEKYFPSPKHLITVNK